MSRILTDKEMEALEKTTKPKLAPRLMPASFGDEVTSASRKVISDSEMAALEGQASAGPVTKTESGIRGAAQGATMGFADEITGGALAAFGSRLPGETLTQAYERERDASRAAYRQAQNENPLSYFGGQVAGGIASSALVPGSGAVGLGARAASVIGGTGKVASIGRGIVQAGTAGAVSGGVTAAGESEKKTLGGIAGDVGGGAAAGGAFGGTLGGLGKLLPGVRGSVSNDFFGDRVLPVTVGAEGAKTAKALLKDPEMRNRIVKLANKDTVKTVKDEVANAVQKDVDTFQKIAGETGAALLNSVEDKMGAQLSTLKESIRKTFTPAIERLDPKRAPVAYGVLAEIYDVFSGRSRMALAELGDNTTEQVVTGNAGSMREVRDIVKQALYKGGNPKDGLKDNLTSTEVKILRSLEAQTQKLFKAIPEAKLADELYSKASTYVQAAQKNLFRKGSSGGKEISNAATEAFVLGKGTAGKVEDLDRMFASRQAFVTALEKATGKKLEGAPAAAIEKARSVMDFNRLGAGDNTGRSLAPLITMLANPKLAPFAAAAYNPRLYLRALAQADNLTSEDRKVLSAIVKAAGRQKDIIASKAFTDKGTNE